MQQVGNPSHLDPWRFGVMGGVAVGLFVLLGTISLLPLLASVLLAMAVAIATAFVISLRIAQVRARREDARQEEYRQTREAETERQIAEMKSKEQARLAAVRRKDPPPELP